MTLHNLFECQFCSAIDFKGVVQHDGWLGPIFSEENVS